MAYYLKKNRLGSYTVVGNDFSDPETEAIAFSKEEYNDFQKREAEQKYRIVGLEAELSKEKEATAAAFQKGRGQYEYIIKEYYAGHDKIEELKNRIHQMEEAYAKKEQEVLHWQKLNGNLLRIHRERANAKRKMIPKGERSGYWVLSTEEYLHRYRVKDNKYRLVSCDEMIWKTNIQSPYTIEFAPQLAKECIENDLMAWDSSGHWRLEELGITGAFHLGETVEGEDDHVGGRRYHYGDLLKEQQGEKGTTGRKTGTAAPDENILLDYQVKLNTKIGYWEVVLFHTKPLTEIGDDWKYDTKKDNKDEKEK